MPPTNRRMRNILPAILVSLTIISTQAQQGAVTFGNGPAGTEIRSGYNGQLISARVALYGSTSTGLGQNETALMQLGAAVDTIAPGYFNGGTRNIGSPGDTVTLQVRAWTGGYATWHLAYAAALVNPNVDVSVIRPMWTQIVGGGTNPTQPITGPGRFQGLVLGIPEPSSIALAIIGTLYLGYCVRRK
jgi:hypothetical protein